MPDRLLRFTLVLLALTLPCPAAVQLGIDRLEQLDFAPLRGKRVGLITNQTGVNAKGTKTRQILHRASGVNLVALFTPEHGLDGTELAGRYVGTRNDSLTGLTAHSLYGPTRKPTPEMLRGLDALVYDMQDIGARSYTYISTMARCMEAAGEAGLEFIVLDRPNPLGGVRVEGPGVESGLVSFVGQIPVPYVHGMTCGELAKMLNAEGWMASRCKLSVVEMQGWSRRMVWEDTGLRWVRTSPNIPRADSPAYYVATGIIGSLAGVDVGVGGPLPFEICGGAGVSAQDMTAFVNSLGIRGVSATTQSGPARLHIEPRSAGNLTALAVHLLERVNRTARPNLFARSSRDKLDIFYKVYGSRSIRDQLASGTPVSRIVAGWEGNVARFEAKRGRYLMY